MFATIGLIILSALTYWVYYRIVNREYFKLIENFVSLGDQELPIIGHLRIFLWKSPHEKIREFCSEALKTERTAKLWIFSKLVIVLNTPQDVQTVLNSMECLEKGTPYSALAGTGAGLITANPELWKSHRRFLNTPFTFQNVVKQIPTMNRIAHKLVEDLTPFCDRGEISLIDSVGYRIMDIALTVVMDYSFDNNTLKKCFEVIEEGLNLAGKRLVKFYFAIIEIFFEKLFRLVPRDQKILYSLAQVLDAAFVAGKQNYLPEIEEDAKKLETDDEMRNRPDGFLKRLYRMAFHNRMTEAQLEENVGQVLIAATDTSTTAVGNVILCLAMHPQVQEELYTNLKSIMFLSEDLDWNKLAQLPYLTLVVKEALRYYPLVPIIMRKSEANIQLEDGIIPAGTDIIIPIDNLHRRKSIWGPNVTQFNPNNFLAENIRKRHPCSFIPFSYGPRNCVGYKYGITSLRIIIAHLILNFRFTTNVKAEDVLFEYGVTVKPVTGYKVSLTKRC